jgi:hypothetical protein
LTGQNTYLETNSVRLTMLFVQYDVRLKQDGELPLDRTFKKKDNIYSTNQRNEFSKRVPLLHFVIRCPDNYSFSLVEVQFFPSSCVGLKLGTSFQNIKEFKRKCRFESSEMLRLFVSTCSFHLWSQPVQYSLSVNVYLPTRRHVPEDLNVTQHRCEKL